jgi:hypothetical protein
MRSRWLSGIPGPRSLTAKIGLDLRGTRALDIVPVGNETTMRLTSAWPHPGSASTSCSRWTRTSRPSVR